MQLHADAVQYLRYQWYRTAICGTHYYSHRNRNTPLRAFLNPQGKWTGGQYPPGYAGGFFTSTRMMQKEMRGGNEKAVSSPPPVCPRPCPVLQAFSWNGEQTTQDGFLRGLQSFKGRIKFRSVFVRTCMEPPSLGFKDGEVTCAFFKFAGASTLILRIDAICSDRS